MALNGSAPALTEINDTRLEWIEPEVQALHVRETAFKPHPGGDGDTKYPDCSKS